MKYVVATNNIIIIGDKYCLNYFYLNAKRIFNSIVRLYEFVHILKNVFPRPVCFQNIKSVLKSSPHAVQTLHTMIANDICFVCILKQIAFSNIPAHHTNTHTIKPSLPNWIRFQTYAHTFIQKIFGHIHMQIFILAFLSKHCVFSPLILINSYPWS